MIKTRLLHCRPYTEEVTRGGTKKFINRTVNLMLRRSISFELYAKEYQLCLGVGGRRSCVRRIIKFSVVSNSAMKWPIFISLVVCLARFCDGLAIKCLPGATDPSCTEERKEFNIPEPNQSPSEATEVQCLAGSEWESNCHYCRCSYQGRAQCLKQSTDCDTGVFAEPALCKPNTTFQRDCNTCICLENGLGLCTLEFCRRSDISVRSPEILLASVNSELDSKDAQKSTKTATVAANVTLSRKVRAYVTTEPPKACQPGTEFRLDCNKCLCDNKGQDYSCTRIDCNAANNNHASAFTGARSKRDTSEQVSMQCVPGSVFDRDCNVCRCTESGKFATCTIKRCTDTKTEIEKAPDSDQGFRCNPGEQFRRDCNDCTCSADGRSVFCTLRLCDAALTTDI